MRIGYNYLNDIDFLKSIAGQHVSEYYVLITALDWEENPIQEIQGRIISGSFNIDGQSSLRRTVSLSMMADKFISNLTNAENLISMNKKINIQVGYKNTTQRYLQHSMLWFPLGIYVISSVAISHSNSGLTVSIQAKDKMCLLNGECGGTFSSSVVFDSYETLGQDGNWIIQRPTIYQIIRELVNHFGGQPLVKIIISDLDTRVKQVMRWTGSSPLYFMKKGSQYYMTTTVEQYNSKCQQGYEDVDGSPFEYGDNVGYILTDFSFPGDLIANAGETVVSILDKIKNILGNYEYFYDINGNFVFQQIKNFLNNAQSKYIIDALNNNKLVPDYLSYISTSEQAYLLDASKGRAEFEFNNSNLISSYNNNPQYGQVKNDFIVWGIKKISENIEMPIRYHLVIDDKPIPGNTYEAFQYKDPDDGIDKWHMPIKYDSKEKFPKQGAAGVFYLDKNTNLIYKWDKLNDIYQYIELDTSMSRVTTNDWRTQLYFQGVTAQPYGTESNFYYTELLNEWPRIFNIEPDYYVDGSIAYANIYVCNTNYLNNSNSSFIGKYYCNLDTKTIYYCKNSGDFNSENFIAQDMTDIDIPSNIYSGLYTNIYYKKGWFNRSGFKDEVIKNPLLIDYYLDFIDTSSRMSEFKVKNIGRRTKVLNEGDNVNCVFQPWIPDIILIGIETSQKSTSDMAKLRQQCMARGQEWYQVPDEIYSRLAIGGILNSGYEVVRQLLHESTSYNQNISIQTLPLYFLEPNIRITVNDNDSNIYGDYLINSMSFALDSSSVLTINASRALEKI